MNPLDMTDWANVDTVALSPRGREVAQTMADRRIAPMGGLSDRMRRATDHIGRGTFVEDLQEICRRIAPDPLAGPVFTDSGAIIDEPKRDLQADVLRRTLEQIDYSGLRAALARQDRTRGWLS